MFAFIPKHIGNTDFLKRDLKFDAGFSAEQGCGGPCEGAGFDEDTVFPEVPPCYVERDGFYGHPHRHPQGTHSLLFTQFQVKLVVYVGKFI